MNSLREDEKRIVVVLLVVVFGVVFVSVVSLSRTCYSVVRCWLGSHGRGDRGRGSWWLFESASYEVTFHSIPFRAVFRRSEPGYVLSTNKFICLDRVCYSVRMTAISTRLDTSHVRLPPLFCALSC